MSDGSKVDAATLPLQDAVESSTHWLRRCYEYFFGAARAHVGEWETSLLMRRTFTRPERVMQQRDAAGARPPVRRHFLK